MMQTVLTNLSTPSAEMVAYGLLMFIGGMAVPTRYGIERLEGFGRAMASKMPYQAPPGMDEKTAMQQATADDSNTDDEKGAK